MSVVNARFSRPVYFGYKFRYNSYTLCALTLQNISQEGTVSMVCHLPIYLSSLGLKILGSPCYPQTATG